MLSYQHAYHAGGLADLHKHAVLAGYLDALVAGASARTRLRFIDTHAGRGIYNLRCAEALKTGDAARGIERLRTDQLPPAYARAVLASRRLVGCADAYPGSPAVASALLRPGDELLLYERHPAEHAALRRRFFGARARVACADGPAALLGLAAAEACRPGLVLVDPSYELPAELAHTAAFVRQLLSVWRSAPVLVWYPLLHERLGKDASTLLVEPLAQLRPAVHEVRFARSGSAGLQGSGLLLLNAGVPAEPLFAAAEALVREALAAAEPADALERPTRRLYRREAGPAGGQRAATAQQRSPALRPRRQQGSDGVEEG